MSPRRAFWLVAVLGFVAAARAAEPDPELVRAEKALKDAGIETDGPALLRFLRARTLTDADRARLPDAVLRLGDDDFDVREKAVEELLRAGRKALPFLRPALRDTDPERARRAEHCVREIESGADAARVVTAIRVLADRRPEGTAAALLAYLPAADDEATRDAVLRALLAAGLKEGKPDAALTAALTDKEPLRRAAAAHVLGRAAPGHRGAARRLLADADTRVRFEAADALVRAGDKDAIPVLIALLGEGPMTLGYRAQELLYRLAGDKSPTLGLAEAEPGKRAAVAGAWGDWWKAAGPTTDLGKINFEETLQGINVIGEVAGTMPLVRVWACRADGKPLWEIKGFAGPTDLQLLPNGHVLVAEWFSKQITERDREGKAVWSKTMDNYPSTCKRLPNGNTFIATYGELTEVTPDGKTVYSYKNPSTIFRAHRLPNGHIWFACGGDKLVELDAAGKEVRTVKLPTATNAWISLELLPGDRFLVGLRGANKVMEIDGTGKVLWECAATDPTSVVRLPNGNTLVACCNTNTVIEFDRAGKEVWQLKLGSAFCVRRY